MNSPGIRKNGTLSNKFKNFVEKTKHQHSLKNQSDQTSDLSEEIPVVEKFVFTPADSHLEKSFQARENLANFKRYLESRPDDPNEAFQVVQSTLYDAFSDLSDRTAVFKTKLENSKESAKEIDDQIKEKEQAKLNLERHVRNNNGEIRQLKIQLHALKDETEYLNVQLKKTEKFKLHRNKLNLLYEDLLSQKLIGNSNFEQSKVETAKLEKDLELAKQNYDEQKIQLEEEIQKCELKVKDLTNKAKKADQMEKSLSTRSKQDLLEDDSSKSAFVINDNVKVSSQEIKQLRSMVASIQQENDELIKERDSKMMDVDCVMQENLGLKQIIRKMTEG